MGKISWVALVTRHLFLLQHVTPANTKKANRNLDALMLFVTK